MEESRFGNNLIMAIFVVIIIVLVIFICSLVFKLTNDTQGSKEDFNTKELNEVVEEVIETNKLNISEKKSQEKVEDSNNIISIAE